MGLMNSISPISPISPICLYASLIVCLIDSRCHQPYAKIDKTMLKVKTRTAIRPLRTSLLKNDENDHGDHTNAKLCPSS